LKETQLHLVINSAILRFLQRLVYFSHLLHFLWLNVIMLRAFAKEDLRKLTEIIIATATTKIYLEKHPVHCLWRTRRFLRWIRSSKSSKRKLRHLEFIPINTKERNWVWKQLKNRILKLQMRCCFLGIYP